MNTEIECLICHEPPRVPVELICFPCHRQAKGKIGCNELRRVCVLCARRYLQLNIPKNQREFHKKCLICASTVNPRYLGGAEQIYRKDKFTMSRDPKMDYRCFHEELGCSFQGSQMELDRHLQEDCKFRTTTCACQKFYIINEEAVHRSHCPYYKACGKCAELCHIDKLSDHLFEQHGLVKCAHMECDHLSTTDKHQQHMEKECKYRSVVCKHCKCFTRATNLANHVLEHIRDEQRGVQELAKTMMACRQRLDECMDLYTEIMKE